MTRKRFIKKLMGVGISRNTAASIATWVQGSCYGYKVQLPAYLRHYSPSQIMARLTAEERATYNAFIEAVAGGGKA